MNNHENQSYKDRQGIIKYIPLKRTFFIDLLFDPRTSRLMIYSAAVVVVGAALFHRLEGWSWIDSFYFVVVTLTTIGYGDFTPTTPVTKLITIFYGLNGIVLLLVLFDTVRSVRGWDMPSRSGQQKNIHGFEIEE